MSKHTSTHKNLCEKIFKFLEDKEQKYGYIKNVELIHGGHEYGVDIIFNIQDPFGQIIKCGIQVVNGDITTSNFHSILGQLAVAFGHKFQRKSNHNYLDLIYVVTNGKILQSANEHIGSANVGFRNILCLSGKEILQLFKEQSIKKEELNAGETQKSNLIRES